MDLLSRILIYKLANRKVCNIEPFSWENLGYTEKVDNTLDNVEYSWNIKKNWNSDITTMQSKFINDTLLVYMPLVNTSNVTTFRSCFRLCTNLKYIPLLDTSKSNSIYSMFYGCAKLVNVPEFDTKNVEDFRYCFYGCSRLKSIPFLDFSKATQLDNMFADCSILEDTTLANIVSMCISAKAYTGTKTLSFIGLSETQAGKCATASNWGEAQTAGWSTGY